MNKCFDYLDNAKLSAPSLPDITDVQAYPVRHENNTLVGPYGKKTYQLVDTKLRLETASDVWRACAAVPMEWLHTRHADDTGIQVASEISATQRGWFGCGETIRASMTVTILK